MLGVGLCRRELLAGVRLAVAVVVAQIQLALPLQI